MITFKEDDTVLLVYNHRKKWLRNISEGEFHCNFGKLDLNELVNQPFGTVLTTNTGTQIKAILPTMMDYLENFYHESQIIYAKDAGMILLLLDLKPGDVVYEAGTGSGGLTSILATYVGNEGKVITHEVREKAQKAAMKNLKRMKLDNVEFHLRDVKEEGFVTGVADSLVLDMADPWIVLPKVTEVLKIGGKIVLFQPTYNQLEKNFNLLKENNFENIEALELIERGIQLKEGAIRPATRMVGHSGFLVHARYLGSIS
ncbi:MAG: tRNA (adenine-N1)-methyltransferase [Candidatus Heimdallarchaeota archaeon]|nr:tRNA (adenine-N1)-methyltransferase [Candidatus Heimdallarchaeota archaeon]MDH5645480.1 tRNA (adenine-N1)-methyltransferase [Candidatus Heimdallarchaeota archaeon]